MLIPQFTLRRLFLFVAICGVFFLFAGMVVRGNRIPIVLVTGVGALLFGFLVYAFMFSCVWVAALAVTTGSNLLGRSAPASPFAANAKLVSSSSSVNGETTAVVVDDAPPEQAAGSSDRTGPS